MKIIHIGKETKDITQLISSIAWSGDYKQVARTLEINVAVSPHDYYLPKHYIGLGDTIKLLDDKDKEIFQGKVTYKEKSINGTEMQVTVHDGLIHLLKSKGTYNFKNITAEEITKRMCNDFNIKIGSIAETGVGITRIFDGENIYQIIMTAYTKASKITGKKYMPKMIEGKLNIIEKGITVANYTLGGNTSIIDATYSESIENMINIVKIYDENGKYIGEVKNDDWVKKFGIFQDVYKRDKGKETKKKTVKKAAKKKDDNKSGYF